MTITTIDVSGQIELSYDENSKEFKEALESYSDVMDRGAGKNEMLRHVAFYVTRFGVEGMVEGVGYVGYNGRKPVSEPYSGIMVGEDNDEFDFEIR